MQTYDLNHNDFQQGRESEADSQLMVKFFLKEREDKEATAKEGRPIFVEREYIEIRIAGKRDAQACRPATHADKQRFPRHYDMFKQRVEAPSEGTPLSEWPQISRTMVEELSFLHVKTVEQLVSVSDGDISRIRGGVTLREKAKAFLEYSDQTKLVEEKQALEERLAKQDAEMAEMRQMLADMQEVKAADKPAQEEVKAADKPAQEEEKPKRRRTARKPPEIAEE